MELIPILSTIILVATICTFVLAVGAYILYKIQGKKPEESTSEEVENETVELVEPEDFGGRQLPIMKSEKVIDKNNRAKPIAESVLRQQRIDKAFQESERKKIKRKPTEPKYLKYSDDNQAKQSLGRNGSAINWR